MVGVWVDFVYGDCGFKGVMCVVVCFGVCVVLVVGDCDIEVGMVVVKDLMMGE